MREGGYQRSLEAPVEALSQHKDNVHKRKAVPQGAAGRVEAICGKARQESENVQFLETCLKFLGQGGR